MGKILVVDDEELIRDILRQILQQDGHEVIEAGDGDTAIKTARDVRPDLIVLDMVMPKMTGLEIAPVLRSHPGTKNIPIIALTGSRSPETTEDIHNAGCDRYIAKPINAEQILGAVAKLLNK
ncbi:response regulator [Thalassospiraceae bacterium LMO-JJ14]|nr:response regulator [Thalassospiraceae bacterium LMO-JJ14]